MRLDFLLGSTPRVNRASHLRADLNLGVGKQVLLVSWSCSPQCDQSIGALSQSCKASDSVEAWTNIQRHHWRSDGIVHQVVIGNTGGVRGQKQTLANVRVTEDMASTCSPTSCTVADRKDGEHSP